MHFTDSTSHILIRWQRHIIGNVKQAVFFANARNYESTLQMYLSGSFIPESVYTNLIEYSQ